MKILGNNMQSKILEEVKAIDDILDEFVEAKAKCIEHIANIVGITCGLDGLITMRNRAATKAHEALVEAVYKGREE